MADLFNKVFGEDDVLIQLRVVHRDILDILVDRRELIGRQCPRSRCPNQEAGVLAVKQRKEDVDRRVHYGSIALADFAGAQPRSALSPPPDDLVALVQQSTVKQILERPPHRLDVRLMVGHVSAIEFDPESQPLSQSFPLLHVGPDGFLTQVDEGLDAMGFDFFFGVNAKLF